MAVPVSFFHRDKATLDFVAVESATSLLVPAKIFQENAFKSKYIEVINFNFQVEWR